MACKYTLNGKEYTEKELINLASSATSLLSVRTRTNNETVELMKNTASNRFVNLDLFTPYQEATYIQTIGADVIQQLGALKPKMDIKITPKKAFLNTQAKFENSMKVYDYLISKLDTNEKLKQAKSKPEYIQKFPQLDLVETIDDLVEKRDTFKNILDNFNGFKTKVKIYLRKFGLITNESSDKFEELKFDEEYLRTLINEEEDTESFTEEERYIRESFEDGSVFLKNPKDTTSARVKQFFAIVPSGRVNALGVREYMSYDEIVENFLKIGSELAVVNYDNLQKALSDKSKGRPYLKNVSAMLSELKNSGNTALLNQILTFANKAFQEQILVKWNRSGVGVDVKIMKSNRSTVIHQIYEDWLEGQKNSDIITSKNGQLVIDKTVAASLKKNLEDVRTAAVEEKKAWVKKFMSSIGINFTDAMIDELQKLADEKKFRKANKNGSFAQLFEDNNLFSIIINKYNTLPTGKAEVAYEEANNALKDEHTSFNILAEIYYDFTPGRYYASSSRNGENKSIYAYIEPSFLERVKKKIKYGSDFIGEVLKRSIAKSSNALAKFRNSQITGTNTFTLELDYLDSLKEDRKGRDGVVRKRQSPKEQTIEAIFKHQNGGAKTGLYNMFTLSNKTVTPVTNITKYKLNDNAERRNSRDIVFMRYEGSLKGSFEFGDTFKNELYNLAQFEIDRIIDYSRQLEAGNKLNDANFDKAFGMFYLFPILNKSSLDEDGARMEEIRNKLYQGVYPSEAEVKYIKEELATVFKNQVIDTLSKYVKEGIIEKVTTDGKVDLNFPNFDNKYMNQPEVSGLTNLQKAIYSIADFKFNYLRAQVTNLQVLGADPALFFKMPKTLKKGVDIDTLPIAKKLAVVRSTMDEFSKRAAMFIAPGGQGVWTWYDKNGNKVDRTSYSAITIQDVVLDTELFSGVETTDAQEFITLQEHIDRLMSMGRISEDIWQSLTNKIEKNLGKNYDLTDEEKAIVYQPTKPVYTNSTESLGSFSRVDYVKSSAFPLIPSIVSATPLDELRKLMETKKIRSANFKSAKKTGQPAKILQVFDDEGNFVQPSIDNLKASTQTLTREGLHNQQEIPEQKDEIANVSQMNRTILDGLLNVEDFVLEGEEFTGREFKNLKENIRVALFSKAEDEMLSRMGMVDTGSKVILKNKKAFESLLLEEALERGYSINDVAAIKVDENGDLIIPLYLMARSEKFEGLINSLITKIVRQKNPGTSLVQVTGAVSKLMMSDLNKDVKNDIIWLPNYDPKTGLKYMRRGESKIDRKGNIKKGEVQPAQVIVSQYIRDEQGNLIDLSKFVTKDKNGRNILDTSKFSEEVFQMVASRIPNQSHPSMLPIEVVGFLPSYMENTIIVPNGITKQMGSDFDVDKLYAYLSTFRFRYSTKTENAITDLEKKKLELKQANEKTNTELFQKFMTTEEMAQIDRLKESKKKVITKMKWNVSQKEKERKQKTIDNINKVISSLYENVKERNKENYLKLRQQQELNNSKLSKEIEKINKEIADLRSTGITGVDKVGYDLSKYNGTAESLQNFGEDELHQMYRDLHWSVLTHPETFDKITKSIDVADLAEEEKLLEELGLFESNLNYTPMDIEEQIQVFLDNKSGAVGTGVFANLGSFLADNQDKSILLGVLDKNMRPVITPVDVLDDNGNKLSLYKITEEGSTAVETKNKDGEVVLEKRTKGDNNNILLSESVDNAKNKMLYKFNWSDDNMSAISALISLSDKENNILSIKFATRFFKQNAIVEYNKELQNIKDSFSEFIPDADKVAKDRIIKKYESMMSEDFLKARQESIVDGTYKPRLYGSKSLLSLLKDGKMLQYYQDILLDSSSSTEDLKDAQRFINEYAYDQLEIIDLHTRLTEIGMDLSRVISSLYPYAKGIGSTVFDVIDNIRKVGNLANSKTFLNLEELAGSVTVVGNTVALIDPKGEIGNSIEKSLMLAQKIYREIYPIHFSEIYNNMLSRVFSGLGIDKNTVDSKRFIKINKQLIKAVRSYLFTSPSLELAFDIPAERERLLVDSENNKSLATRIKEASEQNSELAENYFFRNLKTNITTVNGGTSQVFYNNPFGDIDELENNKGFLSLIFSGKNDLIDIAKDLALYTYVTGGNQNNSSFGKFIPIEYFLNDKEFAKGMRGLSSVFFQNQFNQEMYRQIVQNNPDLATRIDKKAFDTITKSESYKKVEEFVIDANSEFLNTFTVESTLSDSNNGTKHKKVKKFADFVIYYDPQSSRNYLYERISSPARGKYKRINTLGTPKAGFVEYAFGQPSVESILQLNMTRDQYQKHINTYGLLEDNSQYADVDKVAEGYTEDFTNNTVDPSGFQNFNEDDVDLDTMSRNFQNNVPTESDLKDPKKYINHSGGATQADSIWDEMGKLYGVVNHKHYYDESMRTKPPMGNTPLTKEQMDEGIAKVKVTYAQMGRPDNPKYYSLHGRNWFQVKNADAVFAVSDLIAPGEIGRKDYLNKTGQTVVEGGTGYAVQMAINEGKPVYVYHQNTILSDTYDQGWYSYDYNNNQWVKTETPKLTMNFAGIGTSDALTEDGVEAIEDVYKKTFGSMTELENNEVNRYSNSVEVEYTPKGKARQTYTIIGNKIFNSKGAEVFKEDSRDRNKIFANLKVQQGRAVIVNYRGNRYIVNDKDQIMSVKTGDIMQWGQENGDRKAIIDLANQQRAEKVSVVDEGMLEGDLVENNMVTDTPLTDDEMAANIDPGKLLGMDEFDPTEVNIENLDNQPIVQKQDGNVQQINDPVASTLILDLVGINNAKTVIDNIFKTTTNPFFKTLGKTISTDFLKNVSIVVDTQMPFPGAYRANLIRINPALAQKDNPALSAKDNLETVIMHEIMHGFTADIMKKFETNPASLSPRLKSFADNLNKMFIKTRNDILRDIKHSAKLSEVIGLLASDKAEVTLTVEQKSKYYGLTNVNEFISMLMTDRGFQQFMNTVMYSAADNQSVLDKFKALISDLIKTLASALGITVSPDSVLNNGVSRVVSIINERDMQDFTPTEDTTNGDSDEGGFNMDSIDQEKLGEYQLVTPHGVFDANDDQVKAIDKAAEFLNKPLGDKLEDNVFLLYGPGGTGKTASLASAIRKAKKSTTKSVRIAYSAISHTAKGELVKAGNADARTFASMIGARPTISKTGEETFDLLDISEFTKDQYPVPMPDIYTADWIIIDESSMIGDKEMEAIRRRLKERESYFRMGKPKILFMGDYAQIAPVGVKPDGDGWPIALMNNSEKSIGLTKIERTKNQDITDLGFRFRRAIDYFNDGLKEGIASVSSKLKAAYILDSETAKSTDNIKYTKNSTTFIKDFVDVFSQDPNNSASTVIISYNNEKHPNTIKTTNEIRKSLFGNAANSSIFLPGEPVFIKNTIDSKDLVTGKTVELSTNSRVIIKNIRSLDREFNVGTVRSPRNITVPVYEVEAYYGKSLVKITAFDKKFTAQLKNYTTNASGKGGYVLSDGSFLLYSDLKKLEAQNVVDLFHGYIMSAHKVQGQTYNYPFVDEANIISYVRTGADNQLILTPKDYARIVYTGVSRAKKKAYILTSRTSDEKGTFVEPVVEKPLQSIGTEEVLVTEFPKELELENQCKS